jgi:hypothetical protein
LLPNGELEIELPKLVQGTHDILLTGVGFHFTLQSAYRVQAVEVLSISKFSDVKRTAAASKIVKDVASKMTTKISTRCVLTLNTRVNGKTATDLSSQARSFCNGLNLNSKFLVVRSGEPTKLELQIRGW